MNGKWVAVGALLCIGAAAWAAAPTVSNVGASQRAGTPYVDITYDLADVDSPTLSVTVEVSTNGGAVFFAPTGLSGDVGGSVARGTGRRVVWNAGSDLPAKLFNNVRARVTAQDAPGGMVLIPGGSNSGTDPDFGAYSLTVSAFYMDKCEVTQAQWDAVYTWAMAHGYSFSAGWGKGASYPVHDVMWYDCVKWCNARSEREGRPVCYRVGGAVYRSGYEDAVTCNLTVAGYRLPTDTEWEYAARGGASSRRFPWGNTIDHSRANYYGWPASSGGYSYDTGYEGWDTRYSTGDYPYTAPVGSFGANGYGLYDMAGNVWEWCWDWYPGYEGSRRVDRGGSWSGYANSCQVGSRGGDDPDYAHDAVGFRAVLPPGQQ